jgi:hypothetical protein
VLSDAKCSGRHADFVNKIKAQFSPVAVRSRGVGSSNLSGRAKNSTMPHISMVLKVDDGSALLSQGVHQFRVRHREINHQVVVCKSLRRSRAEMRGNGLEGAFQLDK